MIHPRDKMAFGYLLDVLRAEANLSWAALGQAAGVERSAASKWGKGSFPRSGDVAGILAALSPSEEDARRLVTAYARETGSYPAGCVATVRLKTAEELLAQVKLELEEAQ